MNNKRKLRKHKARMKTAFEMRLVREEKNKTKALEEEYIATKRRMVDKKSLQEDEERRKKIQHNMEILKALEEEYLKEQSTRNNANAALEAEGAVTIEEKMKIIQSKAVQYMEQQQQQFSENSEK